MTKQEWIKRIEILMLTGRDCFGVCEEYNCTDCQDKAKEVYEGIEQDLLKEFVEWLKEQCKDIYQLYNEEMQEETDSKNSMWFIGRKDGVGEVRQLLKMAIEKFLEERK